MQSDLYFSIKLTRIFIQKKIILFSDICTDLYTIFTKCFIIYLMYYVDLKNKVTLN